MLAAPNYQGNLLFRIALELKMIYVEKLRGLVAFFAIMRLADNAAGVLHDIITMQT
jgi:hypothetical protein